MRSYERSKLFLEESNKYLAGGLSSSVRAGDKPFPLFFKRGQRSRIFDADENEYIDYVLGRGPLILGHTHPAIIEAVKEQLGLGQIYAAQTELEIELSKKLCEVIPCAELVRFSVSGSEAVQAALRLARAYTKKQKIIKFEGHYHGWLDNIFFSLSPSLSKAGPLEHPHSVPISAGQADSDGANILVLPWNHTDIFRQTIEERAADVAAVIMEPIMCNTGVIEPLPGYLESVRDLCRRHNVLLIFDEVITGFRLGLSGAQGFLKITPDLAIFGKALAAGFALSCIAGRREVMELIARGDVVHSGTFNSQPISLAAALKALQVFQSDRGTLFERINKTGQLLMDGIRQTANRLGLSVLVQGFGSVFFMAFLHAQDDNTLPSRIIDYRSSLVADVDRYDRFVCAMSDHGVRLIPKGLWFVSAAHNESDVELTLSAVASSMQAVA